MPPHDTASRTVPRPAAIRRLAAAGFAALSLAACGTPGPSPMTTFPPTTPPTATPSASPSPTTAPEPEPEPTSTAPTSRAEASWEVVEKFFDAYTHGIQTGDSSGIVELSTPDCQSCRNHIDDVEELGARDVIGTGGVFSFPRSIAHSTKRADQIVWEVHYRQSAATLKLSNPHNTLQVPEESAVLFVELTEKAEGWRVSGLATTADVTS